MSHTLKASPPLNTLPKDDGFFMPAEFAPHDACLMIWPSRPGSWPHKAHAGRRAFHAVAKGIARSEKVYMLVNQEGFSSAQEALGQEHNIELIPMESDDAWARDVGPTFVVNAAGQRRGIDWVFNAWGGHVDGLYSQWQQDDQVATAFCHILGDAHYSARPFVLEGGAIHSDGEGTILVTESCLLSEGRNPHMSRQDIEATLCAYLGAEKVIWLPRGIWQDETNEHVDNVCAFVRPAEVVLAWTDDENDPQYALSKACLDTLEAARDAQGRSFTVHKLPIPAQPVCITEEDLTGYVFAEGEDFRELGERLAASYVNFYISNGHILLPQFGDAHDSLAVEIMASLFPEREILPIAARDILVGGGNIHCITQQIPQKK